MQTQRKHSAKSQVRMGQAHAKRERRHAKATRKGMAKAPVNGDQSVNLRCPREDCGFLAKTNLAMLAQGRLRCPVHHTILQTKDERGETRGRHAA